MGPGQEQGQLTEARYRFETALLIFNDPLALTVQDPYAGEERLRTIGRIGNIILVIHIAPEFEPETGEVLGRIISAL